MTTQIRDGTGGGFLARVSSDHRLLGDAITEPVAAERSRHGKLWGLGTGSLTVTSSMSLGSVLWFSNGTVDEDWYIQKLIFGWNGGSTNFNRTIFSLISYNTAEPTANNTAINAQIENIAKSGATAPVTKNNFSGYKWDGVGAGMTSGSGGYSQIPNRLAQGDTSIPIDGEIVLGPGNSMEFQVTPEETGLFHVSAVFYTIDAGGERADD